MLELFECFHCSIKPTKLHRIKLGDVRWIQQNSSKEVYISMVRSQTFLLCDHRREYLIYIYSAGHKIEEIPEVPLVVSDKVEEYKKTKEAVALLKKVKAWNDIQKVTTRVAILILFVYIFF